MKTPFKRRYVVHMVSAIRISEHASERRYIENFFLVNERASLNIFLTQHGAHGTRNSETRNSSTFDGSYSADASASTSTTTAQQ